MCIVCTGKRNGRCLQKGQCAAPRCRRPLLMLLRCFPSETACKLGSEFDRICLSCLWVSLKPEDKTLRLVSLCSTGKIFQSNPVRKRTTGPCGQSPKMLLRPYGAEMVEPNWGVSGPVPPATVLAGLLEAVCGRACNQLQIDHCCLETVVFLILYPFQPPGER